MLRTSLLGALPAGTVLGGRYCIIRLLGQGGMSRVYLAEDSRLGVQVAVKENLQATPEARRQFEREARILARLSHPNLPGVIDHFADQQTGRQYLVMDYVEGEDLQALVKRTGPLPEQTALAWVRQVLNALEYLHRQQPPVIHRDVKSGNIKITPQGKAVLVDFGIAKVGGPGQSTLTGARAVTPGYAPPEQYGMRTTERSDIYSVGATLYTLLTGRVPPEAPLRMSGDRLIPPRQVVSAVSQSAEAAVLRAMEMDTSRRWNTVSALHQALRGRSAAEEAGGDRADKGMLRVILAGLAALAIVAAVVLLPQIVTPRPAPSPTAVGEVALVPPTDTPVPATPTPAVPTDAPVPRPPTSLLPPTPTPRPQPVGVVQADKVNVRKGPGTRYPLVAQVAKGTRLEILGRNQAGDWWQVCCVNGQQVWIVGKLVQVEGDSSGVQVVASIPPPPPTPIPAPTPTPVPEFHTISLAEIANAAMDDGYAEPPLGRVSLGSVVFDVLSGLNSATTQANTLPDNPVQLSVGMNIAQPLRVHLLITAGNLFTEYSNKQIGIVHLEFEGNQSISFPLSAGQTIREWKILHDDTIRIATSPALQQVWSGGSKHGGTGVIDMLTLEIPTELQSSRLLRIVIEDTSAETCGSMDPAINLLGVTVYGGRKEQ